MNLNVKEYFLNTLSPFDRNMLDASMAAQLLEHPSGTDTDVDRGVRRDRKGRSVPDEEPHKVSPGQPECSERVYRYDGGSQLRAGSLRLSRPGSIREVRCLR